MYYGEMSALTEVETPPLAGVSSTDDKSSIVAPARLGFYVGLFLASALFCWAAISLWITTRASDADARNLQEIVLKPGQDLSAANLAIHFGAFRVSSQLVTCGIFFATALCFLGLALFLLGYQGAAEMSAKTSQFEVAGKNLAPGLAAMLIASVTLIACLVNRPRINTTTFVPANAVNEGTEDASRVLTEPSAEPEPPGSLDPFRPGSRSQGQSTTGTNGS
jgi:hypothetical protein